MILDDDLALVVTVRLTHDAGPEVDPLALVAELARQVAGLGALVVEAPVGGVGRYRVHVDDVEVAV